MSEIQCKFCGVSHVAGADGCSGYPNVSSATTRRAEEIRETTGMAWEYACLQAERERDRDAAAFGPEIPGISPWIDVDSDGASI